MVRIHQGSSGHERKPYFSQSLPWQLHRLLRWQQLDEFWNVMHSNADVGWYLYTTGAPVPVHQSSAEDVVRFIAEVDELLHSEHHEDYCGIV